MIQAKLRIGTPGDKYEREADTKNVRFPLSQPPPSPAADMTGNRESTGDVKGDHLSFHSHGDGKHAEPTGKIPANPKGGSSGMHDGIDGRNSSRMKSEIREAGTQPGVHVRHAVRR